MELNDAAFLLRDSRSFSVDNGDFSSYGSPELILPSSDPVLLNRDEAGGYSEANGHLSTPPLSDVNDVAATSRGVCPYEEITNSFKCNPSNCKQEALNHANAALMPESQKEEEYRCPECSARMPSLKELFSHVLDNEAKHDSCAGERCVLTCIYEKLEASRMSQVVASQGCAMEEGEPLTAKQDQPGWQIDSYFSVKPAFMMAEKADLSYDTIVPSLHRAQQLPSDTSHFRCKPCGLSFALQHEWFRHMSLGHGFSSFCGYCYKLYKRRGYWHMPRHFEECHKNLPVKAQAYQNDTLIDVDSSQLLVPPKVVALSSRKSVLKRRRRGKRAKLFVHHKKSASVRKNSVVSFPTGSGSSVSNNCQNETAMGQEVHKRPRPESVEDDREYERLYIISKDGLKVVLTDVFKVYRLFPNVVVKPYSIF